MVDDGDDNDDDLSGLLLSLATSNTAIGGYWDLNIHHWWYSPSRQSPTCPISRLLQHAGEHSSSILLTPKPQRHYNWVFVIELHSKKVICGRYSLTPSRIFYSTVLNPLTGAMRDPVIIFL